MCRFLMKCILFIVNLLFTLIGLALVGTGIAILVNLDDWIDEFLDLIPINLKLIPYFIIGVGGVIFLIAFCGCCGSVTESKCMLLAYAICMALLAAIKIFIAIEISIRVDEMKDTVENAMNKVFVDPQLNATFQFIETTLSCCGTTGPDAYNITINGTAYLPYTCCEQERESSDDFPILCLKENAYEIGCNTVVGDLIDTLGTYSRNILIYIIVSEVLVMSFALYISCTIEKRK